jgi:hypothetical protein
MKVCARPEYRRHDRHPPPRRDPRRRCVKVRCQSMGITRRENRECRLPPGEAIRGSSRSSTALDPTPTSQVDPQRPFGSIGSNAGTCPIVLKNSSNTQWSSDLSNIVSTHREVTLFCKQWGNFYESIFLSTAGLGLFQHNRPISALRQVLLAAVEWGSRHSSRPRNECVRCQN